MKEIKVHTIYTQESIVEKKMLASQVGSGSVEVYATPMLIALMENTAVKCLAPFMEDNETSVGVSIHTTHNAPTPVGMKVYIQVEIIAVDRRKVTFSVLAKDEKDIIGKATHERIIVHKDKFEEKAKQKLS